MNEKHLSDPGETPAALTERQQKFLCALSNGDMLLFDGGVATMLYERGIFINRSFDDASLSAPDLLSEIHREFIAAGANIVTTNSWGANLPKLRGYGLERQLVEINRQAARIACDAAGDDAWVAGSIGPLGVRIEPWGPTSFEEARGYFRDQAKALVDGGVDLFVLESFADLNEIQQAILAVRELGPHPIIAMMATNEEGQSLFGTEPEWFVKKLTAWGADVVGVNGGGGPAPLLELARRLMSCTEKPLILKPNAGSPRMVDGRLIYMAIPEYLGEFARQALLIGVRILGGCSGTTPAHIRAMAASLRQDQAFRGHEFGRIETGEQQDEEPAPELAASHWAEKLRRKEFVLSVELLPPRGLDPSKIIGAAQLCKERGIDAINIPDGPRASARMSALATACLIEREVQIETVLHYTCRDRNILGMQSDLIGAAGLGLRNLLCITGDPPKMGPYPNATAVFDIDSIGLVNMVARLNTGRDLGGTSIGRSTGFSIGVGGNPVAPDLDREYKRFRYKVEAGAHWAMTQPVFDPESLFRFIDFASQFGIPIIAGIWPLTSLRNAEFMANEVPGVYVPPHIIERMRGCQTAEDQKVEGLAIAMELVEKVRPCVQGLQISVPGNNVEHALKLIS
jgi:homocysteine S-methyltransferase